MLAPSEEVVRLGCYAARSQVASAISMTRPVCGTMRSVFRTQRELALESLALRQRLAVTIRTRGGRRPRLGAWDRAFCMTLSLGWTESREALAILEPATVIRWHQEGLRKFWTRESRRRLGRPGLDREVTVDGHDKARCKAYVYNVAPREVGAAPRVEAGRLRPLPDQGALRGVRPSRLEGRNAPPGA
jgi:hypothetical protein